MLYQKCGRPIPSDEAKARNETLEELKHKYQDSLKILKMVEDSKQRTGVPSREAVHGFLLSPKPTLGMSGMKYPSSISGLRMAASNGVLAANLTAATSASSLGFPAPLTSSFRRAPGLPFATSAPARAEAALPLGNEALSCFREQQNLQKILRAGAGTSEVAILNKLTQGRPFAGRNFDGLSPLQSVREKKTSLNVLLQQQRRRGESSSSFRYSQTMVLPSSIAALRASENLRAEMERMEGMMSKKADQNALMLEALLNRKRETTSAFQEASSSGVKRRRYEDSEIAAASKFARLV
jgi:hypothetical protein